jgi:transcriptional regulator with XRE-family HTH domain
MSLASKSIRAVLADNVERLRKKRGWSQTTLGTKSGTSQRTVSNIETQANDPGSEQIEAIASAFGLPGYLLYIPDLPVEILDSTELPSVIERYVAFARGRS